VQPELLLLDEPLTGLDAPTRADLLVDLRDVLARTHTAALLVTHDLHEAVALADRLLVVDAGRIRQDGRTRDVVDRPADRVCAELLGYENIIDGRLAARLLGRPGHVALRARDCTPEQATQRDHRPGDLLLAGRLVHVLPHLERLTVVADIDGTTLRTGQPRPDTRLAADDAAR
jgi:ABC-type sulfate/molybdate transport systems ATPase subunit